MTEIISTTGNKDKMWRKMWISALSLIAWCADPWEPGNTWGRMGTKTARKQHSQGAGQEHLISLTTQKTSPGHLGYISCDQGATGGKRLRRSAAKGPGVMSSCLRVKPLRSHWRPKGKFHTPQLLQWGRHWGRTESITHILTYIYTQTHTHALSL